MFEGKYMIRQGGALVIALWWILGTGVVPSLAQESRAERLVVGVDIGPSFGTIDGTGATFGVRGDYYISPNLSVGPVVQLGFTDDLTQIGIFGQLKYTFDVPDSSLFRPHVQTGLGFIHADLVESDLSYLFPIGIGFEYQIQPRLFLDTTASLNFTNLDNSVGGNWQHSLNLLFGIRIML